MTHKLVLTLGVKLGAKLGAPTYKTTELRTGEEIGRRTEWSRSPTTGLEREDEVTPHHGSERSIRKGAARNKFEIATSARLRPLKSPAATADTTLEATQLRDLRVDAHA
jgi:hypothetical protein